MDLPHSQSTAKLWSSKDIPSCCPNPSQKSKISLSGAQNELGREGVAEGRIELKSQGFQDPPVPCSKGKVAAEGWNTKGFLTAASPLPFQTLWELGTQPCASQRGKGQRAVLNMVLQQGNRRLAQPASSPDTCNQNDLRIYPRGQGGVMESRVALKHLNISHCCYSQTPNSSRTGAGFLQFLCIAVVQA